MKNFIFGFVVAMWAGPVIRQTAIKLARGHYTAKAQEERKHEHQE